MQYEISVNGKKRRVEAEADAKLLWLLRDSLKLPGTRYGCGIAACGACMVHINGKSAFSCQVPIDQIKDAEITTIEGLQKEKLHPLQQAWIDEQVPQCGYCQSGQLMRAAELLAQDKNPGREKIKQHMNTNLCRCGTYARIIKAVERAASVMGTKNV